IIADFDAASGTLKQLLPSSAMKMLFGSIALLQIMDVPEDGLTELEKRALLELGYESKAQNVILFDHAGHPLTKDQVPPQHQMTIIKILLVIIIMVVLASTWFLTL